MVAVAILCVVLVAVLCLIGGLLVGNMSVFRTILVCLGLPLGGAFVGFCSGVAIGWEVASATWSRLRRMADTGLPTWQADYAYSSVWGVCSSVLCRGDYWRLAVCFGAGCDNADSLNRCRLPSEQLRAVGEVIYFWVASS